MKKNIKSKSNAGKIAQEKGNTKQHPSPMKGEGFGGLPDLDPKKFLGCG